ncbi:hypothetical protein PUV54_14670 [Hyphococcus flavus]|uniref:Uncharacterized protein n=1 Tax=Hyphococcus flavus TaxID=1866326 RepID=A0AAE9ZDX6_9PROT|nr:hypothetical protein [Hyphococcus flavus]WDI31192.1 hypothetical protein PUV54_14670 [Hyphococcus flavus]
MLRSLVAVIIAVVAGLAVAKLIEGGAAALMQASASSTIYQAFLALSWFTGSFSAALIALFIARRWVPVGVIAAASMFVSAIVVLVSSPLHWILWPAAAVLTFCGGALAIKVTSASYALPQQNSKDGLFDE